MLDTGSSDLWVDTTLGTAHALVGSPSPEPTIVDTGIPALLEYGVEGVYTYALGNVQYASIEVSSATSGDTSLVLRNQSFGTRPKLIGGVRTSGRLIMTVESSKCAGHDEYYAVRE